MLKFSFGLSLHCALCPNGEELQITVWQTKTTPRANILDGVFMIKTSLSPLVELQFIFHFCLVLKGIQYIGDNTGPLSVHCGFNRQRNVRLIYYDASGPKMGRDQPYICKDMVSYGYGFGWLWFLLVCGKYFMKNLFQSLYSFYCTSALLHRWIWSKTTFGSSVQMEGDYYYYFFLGKFTHYHNLFSHVEI